MGMNAYQLMAVHGIFSSEIQVSVSFIDLNGAVRILLGFSIGCFNGIGHGFMAFTY